MGFLEGGFVKSSLLHFLDNGKRDGRNNTKTEVRTEMSSITKRSGDVTPLEDLSSCDQLIS